MLSEETVLVIALLAAAALLIVALLEVVWPSRGRHPRARARYGSARAGRQGMDRATDGRAATARREPFPAPRPAGSRRPEVPSPRSIGIGRESPLPSPRVSQHEAPAAQADGARPATPMLPPRVPPREIPLSAAPPALKPAEPAPPAPPRPAPAAETPEQAPAPPAPTGDLLPLEECFTLYQDQRYADVITTAVATLEQCIEARAGSAKLAHEVAALWSIMGLSKQALNDENGARAAFEEAIVAAPAAEQSTYQRHLAALALTAGRKLIARAETLPETAGEGRVTALRHAVLWLRQGLACAPDDANLSVALERSRKSLWVSYGKFAATLIQRQEFHGARRLIREALAEEDFPEDRREVFKDLLATTFSGEIGHLTAHAIRVMQDEHEREASTSLRRAESLLSSIPSEALTPKRREEVNRRLWWGYTKLGVRRVESGAYEDALEPLFHALQFGEVDPERQRETRTALVRALEGVTEARVESIDQLLKSGKRDAAVQEGDRLRKLLREGMEVGLSEHELTSALTRTHRVLEQAESGS
ncbi:MAG: hypothetical protein DMD82_00465 [Candidatus Rokuibacteriota bacterium]|nr:MAG: hypothetical protein DMD82_00465 [Candidatus Rokubacteria bacterium]